MEEQSEKKAWSHFMQNDWCPWSCALQQGWFKSRKKASLLKNIRQDSGKGVGVGQRDNEDYEISSKTLNLLKFSLSFNNNSHLLDIQHNSYVQLLISNNKALMFNF